MLCRVLLPTWRHTLVAAHLDYPLHNLLWQQRADHKGL